MKKEIMRVIRVLYCHFKWYFKLGAIIAFALILYMYLGRTFQFEIPGLPLETKIELVEPVPRKMTKEEREAGRETFRIPDLKAMTAEQKRAIFDDGKARDDCRRASRVDGRPC